MRAKWLLSFVALALVSPLFAAPPAIEIPAVVKAEPLTWVTVSPKTDAVSVLYVGLDGLAAFPSSELKDPRKLIVNPVVPGKYRFVAVAASNSGEQSSVSFAILVGDAPIPPGPQPPGPQPPEPKPPEPVPPQPVTSYKVIFVYESSKPITPEMQKVMYGSAVVDYLEAKTTPVPGVARGFRRYDKDVDATNERDPEIKTIWAAVKPKLTTVPCVVIAVNNKATIEPWPATEDAALALFKKYVP